LTGCEDFLDTQPTDRKTTENYPTTPEDALQVLTGVYSILSRPNPLSTFFVISELRSDDRLGAGGPGDVSTKAIAQYQKWSENSFSSAWRIPYMGIFRANTLLEAMDQITWDNESQRKQVEGEVRYLRAHYYFDLSRMFGDICLLTTTEPLNVPRSPAAETYAVIASDLKAAIENLPSTAYNQTESGRVTKWAAEALMARVFLFYTGFYQKESLPLPDGGSITKSQVTTWLVDCIENSGHDLVGDFRNLWPYSYVNDYAYTAENGLNWEGDGNKETVFAIKYTVNLSGNYWDNTAQKTNHTCLYFGLRGQGNYLSSFPFGQGWGMGTVNSNTWDQWPEEDVIRKMGSIFDVMDKTEFEDFNMYGDSQMDETGYYQKKYMPVNVYTNATKTSVQNYSIPLYGNTQTNFMLNNVQDLVLMRFADVLLMAAELGASNAQAYMDKVRTRVNLPSVPATLENIKNERRFELAFEGIRFHDLLRWHDEQVLDENQRDIRIYVSPTETVKRSIKYRPETGGFLQIPSTEIDLSKGVLTPNPGWGAEAEFSPLVNVSEMKFNQ